MAVSYSHAGTLDTKAQGKMETHFTTGMIFYNSPCDSNNVCQILEESCLIVQTNAASIYCLKVTLAALESLNYSTFKINPDFSVGVRMVTIRMCMAIMCYSSVVRSCSIQLKCSITCGKML